MRIGIGPSSSHTVGPMRAGRAFSRALAEAVRLGLGTPDVLKAPASCCRGEQTTWYLDEPANALMTD